MNLEIGDTNASIESFRNLIEKDPKNYLALFYTSEAYQNIGLTDSAKLIFKNIAELNDVDFVLKDTIKENEFPLRTYALFNLARIYISTNRTDSAKIVLNEIIDNQLTFGPAYRQLGIIFNNEGNPALGNQYANRANDLIDYNPSGYMLIEKISLISRSDTYLLKQIDDAIRSQNFNWALKLFDH